MSGNELPDSSQIIAAALRLPLDERITLANAMLDSVEDSKESASQSEIDESWNDEIAKRVRELETGKLDTIPSSEIWKELGGKPNA